MSNDLEEHASRIMLEIFAFQKDFNETPVWEAIDIYNLIDDMNKRTSAMLLRCDALTDTMETDGRDEIDLIKLREEGM